MEHFLKRILFNIDSTAPKYKKILCTIQRCQKYTFLIKFTEEVVIIARFFEKKISKLRNIKGDKYMIIINGLLFGFTFEILAPVKR